VWPETAVPGWIPNEPRYVEWLANLARQSSTHLLVGAASHQEGKDYNAVFLISSTGTILQQYRKRHLVPFGEVVPFKNLLARWIRVMNELGEMTKSDNWTVFQLDAGTRGPGSGVGNNEARPASGPVYFSANICFESLFPGLVRGFVRRGAGLTFNLTNDGWFLETAAPEQHFIASVFRAVETRTWVVRAANTGISGFIDPDGRVRSRTGLTERAMLRGSPRPTFRRTLYTRTGDAFALLCALTAATCLFLASRTARRPSSRRSLDSSPTHR
jgi:apolipoprotein N-acyltransferase